MAEQNFEDINAEILKGALKQRLKNKNRYYILPFRQRGYMTLIGQPKADLDDPDDFTDHFDSDVQHVSTGGDYSTRGTITLTINQKLVRSDTVILTLAGPTVHRREIEDRVKYAARKLGDKIKSIDWA